MNRELAQKQTIAQWVNEGMKLADIQKRLDTELGIRITYMELRLLVNELQVMPKDQPKTATPVLNSGTPAPAPQQPTAPPTASPDALNPEASAPGGVSVTVDKVTRPGAMVSGSVTFSDGNTAAWYLDQMGRLGLVGKQPGYRPPGTDLQEFQMLLEQELAKSGF